MSGEIARPAHVVPVQHLAFADLLLSGLTGFALVEAARDKFPDITRAEAFHGAAYAVTILSADTHLAEIENTLLRSRVEGRA